MGKSSSTTPPPPIVQESSEDTTSAQVTQAFAGMQAMMQGMMQSYSSQMQQMQQMMSSQINQPLPTIRETTDIDWKAKQDELANKVRADYGLDQRKLLNSATSVYTSPLLDEEEAETTNISLVAS